ncbi:MAG: hypothetical protein A2252_10480 [Elusimicrobia bacterium RIFOXYA2_FULL_39_19]|nr:MAG: hypothetical protein A2252_10480 [Elusimicrobia bacterium RIFOXYA2_FULL_39_19]
MEKVNLRELTQATQGKLYLGNPSLEITSISTDTRNIKQGDMFFALKGVNFDGHKFVDYAIKQGASGVVISEIDSEIDKCIPNTSSIIVVKDTLKALGDFAGYYRKKIAPLVVAVTGSSGKTTTKEMIYHILKVKGNVHATKKNYNNLIGVPLTLLELTKEHKYSVLELGISLKGEMDRLIEITRPDVGIITNIGKTHLEYLGDTLGVFNEKSKLLRLLEKDKVSILNFDDPYLNGLKDNLRSEILTFGLSTNADIYASDVKSLNEKMSFNMHLMGKRISMVIPVPGLFNVYNALAAVCACHCLGIDIEVIKKALEQFSPMKMRMERIMHSSGAILINDAYNANPESMKQSITSFMEAYPEKEKIIVIGDMLELGEHTQQEHKALGKLVTELPLSGIYLYGKYIKAIKEDNPADYIEYFTEQPGLEEKLKKRLNANTAVLFKASRGIGLEKIVNNL